MAKTKIGAPKKKKKPGFFARLKDELFPPPPEKNVIKAEEIELDLGIGELDGKDVLKEEDYYKDQFAGEVFALYIGPFAKALKGTSMWERFVPICETVFDRFIAGKGHYSFYQRKVFLFRFDGGMTPENRNIAASIVNEIGSMLLGSAYKPMEMMPMLLGEVSASEGINEHGEVEIQVNMPEGMKIPGTASSAKASGFDKADVKNRQSGAISGADGSPSWSEFHEAGDGQSDVKVGQSATRPDADHKWNSGEKGKGPGENEWRAVGGKHQEVDYSGEWKPLNPEAEERKKKKDDPQWEVLTSDSEKKRKAELKPRQEQRRKQVMKLPQEKDRRKKQGRRELDNPNLKVW